MLKTFFQIIETIFSGNMTHDSLQSKLKWKSNLNKLTILNFLFSYEIKEITKFYLGMIFL